MPPQRIFGYDQGDAPDVKEDDPRDEEGARPLVATVLSRNAWKAPDIPRSNGDANDAQKHSKTRREALLGAPMLLHGKLRLFWCDGRLMEERFAHQVFRASHIAQRVVFECDVASNMEIVGGAERISILTARIDADRTGWCLATINDDPPASAVGGERIGGGRERLIVAGIWYRSTAERRQGTDEMMESDAVALAPSPVRRHPPVSQFELSCRRLEGTTQQ